MRAEHPARARRRALAWLTLTPLLWAGNWALGKTLVGPLGADPVLISAARWALAAAALYPLVRRVPPGGPPPFRARRLAGLAGWCGIAGYTTLQYVALRYTSAVNGSLIFSASPLMSALLAPWAGERLGPAQWTGAALGLAGVALILRAGSAEGPGAGAAGSPVAAGWAVNPGDLLMVLASLLWAVYSLLVRRAALLGLPPLQALWWSTLSALPPLAAAAAWAVRAGGALPATPAVAGALAYMVLGSSLLAFYGWNEGVRVLGTGRAAVFGNLLPVYTALLSVPLLSERLSAVQVLGGALVAAGVALAAGGAPVVAGRVTSAAGGRAGGE